MAASTFDTLSAARDLEASGFTRDQAETAVKAMRDAADTSRTDLASRADLHQLEVRLTWRLLGIAAAIVAAVKFIPPAY